MPLSAERLSRILFDTDPIGTCCKENDCFDEYDAIADDIVSRCQRGQPLDNALDETFEVWFGAELAEGVDMRALYHELTNYTDGPPS